MRSRLRKYVENEKTGETRFFLKGNHKSRLNTFPCNCKI
ncbi:hypothetical protein EAL2_c12660 [Peptoclostridium acidaminophilum DSM 3953]|uniref:Uncharacterized protein n=1 Tax=Peptoclostridium acidaminophilum DSM 3953 TaxID=1286171 RepID=W8U6L5_PEPAC|nr:hypothetical protein EAL2_c12660 [Peptoclostridium acidaminophilum DSM 3953]